ncbi:MAG: response regulator [Deltaproteobacteria bacterium]|nr:response regulator [Nannocystaceae bacterium]
MYRWFLARALPLRDAEGRITRWFGTSTDIDDQKHTEVLADAGNRAKDEFLALLGHELRNPLAPISLALELMQLSWPDVARRERAVILRQVEHLVRLVDDLLDVSRITRGKVELRIERVELAEVVARAVEMTSVAFEQKSHVLTQRVPESGLVVDADTSRLAQVVANLLTNAAKYTKARGEISIEARRRDSSVILEVRDNGIGISSEMLPRVFEMFVQEQQGLDRPQGGLGLGLAIAKNLVEMHGGTLRVRSEGLGRGCVFEVELAAAAGALAGAGVSAASWARVAVQAVERRRILVVDDNEDAADLTAESLVALGHDVRVAFDGPGALAIARDFAPEVALLDIGLPGMDGYELAARLRQLLSPDHPRFIAITGYGEQTAREQSQRAGFDVHLVKPVRLDQLAHEIVRVTARVDTRR